MGRNFFLSMTKIPSDDILEGLYKLRIRESEKLKTVLELHNLETHQKKLGPDYHRLKTMVKRSIEQEMYEIRILGARNGNFEKKRCGQRIREQNSVYTLNSWRMLAMGIQRAVCPKETIAVSATISTSVEKLHHQSPSPNSFMRQNERKASRTRSPRGSSPSGGQGDGVPKACR